MIAINWEKIESQVVERIRVLAALDRNPNYADDKTRDEIRREVIVPCAASLKEFCLAVDLATEEV